MKSTEIKAIETPYNGYRFRSRLEARWAVFFDKMKIPYIYEPEGLLIDGVFYLPDFYLPDCKQFFEVKGFMDDSDQKKIDALISAGYSVTVGYDEGFFQACDNWNWSKDNSNRFKMANTSCGSWLCKCNKCGKYWFMGSSGSYSCQCCGAYEGDHHFDSVAGCFKYNGEWDFSYGRHLWDVARQARFEHGKTAGVLCQIPTADSQ